MRILGIETATRAGSVAIVEEEEITAEYTLNIQETHTSRLMSMIDRILSDAHLTVHEMDAVAVSLGPGSFTGIRIGLATAKGLCLALDKPLVGIPTLDAFAHNISWTSRLICPILEARKGEVYAALYRYRSLSGVAVASTLTCEGDTGRPIPEKPPDFPLPIMGYQLQKLTNDLALSLDELFPKIDGSAIFLGDALQGYRDLVERKLKEKAFFAPPYLNLPRAANVAILGLGKLKIGQDTDPQKIEPLYVRRPKP